MHRLILAFVAGIWHRSPCCANHLKGLDTPVWFFPMFYKEEKFCDFLFALLHTKSLLKRSTQKGKNLLPKGANSFLLEYPFQKVRQNNFDRITSLASVSVPLKWLFSLSLLPFFFFFFFCYRSSPVEQEDPWRPHMDLRGHSEVWNWSAHWDTCLTDHDSTKRMSLIVPAWHELSVFGPSVCTKNGGFCCYQ